MIRWTLETVRSTQIEILLNEIDDMHSARQPALNARSIVHAWRTRHTRHLRVRFSRWLSKRAEPFALHKRCKHTWRRTVSNAAVCLSIMGCVLCECCSALIVNSFVLLLVGRHRVFARARARTPQESQRHKQVELCTCEHITWCKGTSASLIVWSD